tara:strand:+ start:17310 stop:20390 length:3081 start_codon:yes stop_codon:yes gene_type:complete
MEIKLINNKDKEFAVENLTKFYENNLIPAEKKEYLTDHKGSTGPYLGIQTRTGDTHYLMDAASQIATLGLGFSSPVFMGTTQFPASWTNNSSDKNFIELRKAFHNFIKREIGNDQASITFCNSGAESNEKALGYCYERRYHKSANKVLAFKGSFHGRMLVSLSATWNPVKREPFEWEGYKAIYCEYPEIIDSQTQLSFPKGWRETWDNSSSKNFKIDKNWETDPILKKEIESLNEVREKLQSKEIFSIIIEPMQCEGGDRYSSNRFHTALLLLARSYNVPVIEDEVQTGFHLGREFFWHRQFDLKDVDGTQLFPDYVVCAKKAQVGIVIAPKGIEKTKLEKKESFQVASTIRGYLHAMALKQSRNKIHHIEEVCTKKLEELTNKYKDHVDRPRACGISFALDLKDKNKVSNFIAKRFDHGLLYYPAGDKTLRFRLNTAFNSDDINFLFERLDAICADLFLGLTSELPLTAITNDRKTEEEYSWQNFQLLQKFNLYSAKKTNENDLLKEISEMFKLNKNEDLISITKENFEKWSSQIVELQKRTYEPTRQSSIERFRVCANSKYGICLAIIDKDNDKLMAIAFSSSLKDHPLERGIRASSEFHNDKALYVIDTTVDKNYRGRSLGAKLKSSITAIATSRGYEFIQGRNRDQLASRMLHINLSLGSYESNYIKEDYPDQEEFRDVIFYSTPLQWDKEPLKLSDRKDSMITIEDLDEEFIHDQIPYLTNKVCLSNFVNTKFLENVKSILNQFPESLQHGFTTSGQSECVDKLVKTIWVNKKKGPTSITFEGHYFGNGSFLSRSLSSSTDCYFPVRHFDNPDSGNISNILNQLENFIQENDVLGIWLEPIRQLDMKIMPKDVLLKIKKLANTNNIPLIYNETASQAFNYSNDYYFVSQDPTLTPNAGMIFLGGQGGLSFTDESLFLDKPLMMISTWDGDEFSFSAYRKGMEKILTHKDEFLKSKATFNKKIKDVLSSYEVEDLELHNGVGSFRGKVSKVISNLFHKVDDKFLIDPKWKMMEEFNKRNDLS